MADYAAHEYEADPQVAFPQPKTLMFAILVSSDADPEMFAEHLTNLVHGTENPDLGDHTEYVLNNIQNVQLIGEYIVPSED